MQDLSYSPPHPWFTFGGLTFSLELFTFENVYGLHPQSCRVEETSDCLTLRCTQLSWAGGQGTAPGSLELQARLEGTSVCFEISAEGPHPLRSVKLQLRGLPPGKVVNLREGERPVDAGGTILNYPEGWRNLYTPLVLFETRGGETWYFRSLDTEVRSKRFALVERDGETWVELIFEELATRRSTRLQAPAWQVGRGAVDEINAVHAAHLEQSYQLAGWEVRKDVPDWLRRVSLVATIHCQHWTGYIFNDYEKVAQSVRWLAQKIEPERLLVYLPGWEGRYYWKYGQYTPDPRMGGEAGFRRLVDEVQGMGAHVMPMFGINYANRELPGFERWGEPALIHSAGGISGGPTVDWDAGRHFDHGWGALLNPGAPCWQDHLAGQVRSLVEEYGFDGIFLDISAAWFNDPDHEVFPGTLNLVRRIREGYPELLVAGEGWYDAMSAAMPLHQSGHTDGAFHWHDEVSGPMFARFNRSFGHLCQGDAGRGSTGVHELGFNPIRQTPLREAIFPTLSLVDDTINRAPDRVEAILEQARQYAQRYLTLRGN